MALSDEQLAAARRTGQDVCTVAGPGSGKTRVLVERFAWLAGERARPEAILAITFTEKAAREIKTRLVRHFEGRPEMRTRIERALVSTIHGFCHGVLREFATRAGIDPAFRVMDEYEARREQARAIEEALNRFIQGRRAEFHALAEAWAAEDFAEEILDLSDRLRLAGGARKALAVLPEYDAGTLVREIEAALRASLDGTNARTPTQIASRDAVRDWLAGDPGDLLERLERVGKIRLPSGKGVEALNAALKQARETAGSAIAEAIGERYRPCLSTLGDMLTQCEREYAERKRAQGALDFGDLEEQTLLLLEGDETIRRTVSERFDAILMDELQDTNPIQWRIVNAIRREGRFFAVGDINQSIFGFRGANPRQFKAYQEGVEQRGWTVDRLETNYRSRPGILQAVEAICVHTGLEGISAHRLMAGGVFADETAPCVEVIRAEDDAPEAAWVARRIVELKQELRVGPERALRFSDIAILARGAAVFDEYESALRAAGVPCVVQRGRNFFDEAEIVDLLNLLRVLVNPRDEPALLTVLRSPLVGVGDEELLARREAGLEMAPDAVAARLEELRAWREELPADRLLQRYLDESGHWSRLAPAQRANVWKLFRMLRAMDAGQAGGLADQVEELLGVRGAGKEPNAPVPGAVDAVEILSIHKAKGLEFPVVFLVSMHKQPGGAGMQDRLALSERRGLGAVWRREGLDATQADGAMTAAEEERKQRESWEEDRLLYVALTRAEERLVLVWSETRRPDQRWIGPVTQGLGLTWAAPIGTVALENGVRVWRVSGVPPALEASADPANAGETVLAVERNLIGLPESPSVSATALAHFETCPRRYFLRTVLRWPEQPKEDEASEEQWEPESGDETAAGAEFGGEAANGAESSGGTLSGPGFGEIVHRLLAGIASPGAPPEALELVRRFEAGETARRASRASRSGRETPVLFEFAGLLIRGTIDLWFEDNGELVLVDYKTDRHIRVERRREYATQLGLYSIALSRALGRNVDRAVLAVLRTGTEINVTWRENDAGRLSGLVGEFRAAQTEGHFPMRAGRACESCGYAGGACPV
ncbi:MAG: UvrD-helicase domain-containing protein [Bryobacteraceae bacterium]|jgi:ATP-dependent exoDNAse (exonuclease V) beta subunit